MTNTYSTVNMCTLHILYCFILNSLLKFTSNIHIFVSVLQPCLLEEVHLIVRCFPSLLITANQALEKDPVVDFYLISFLSISDT